MRVVVSRVLEAAVTADGVPAGKIGRGLLLLLGIAQQDTEADALYLAKKCCGLRIFDDGSGKMNLPAADTGGALLVVSNFTLCGDCRKGKRPNFTGAARPEAALPLYEAFVRACAEMGLEVQTGVFGAEMQIRQICDGPVTLVIDSPAQGEAAEGGDQ